MQFLALLLLPLLASSAPTPVPAALDPLEAALTAALTTGTIPSNDLLNVRASTDTENGLTDGSPCKALTLIFARGTFASGNVGTGVGPTLIADVRSSLGTASVTAQGVDYPADLAGYLAGGDDTGAATMASLVNQAASQCPGTKIVMSGYSQGGQLVHKAASQLSATISAQVVAVVLFGDPDNGQSVGTFSTSEVDSFCHDQDIVCTGSGGYTTHLTYANDAPAAAAFIVSASGL